MIAAAELLGAAWETVTLGQVAIWVGLAGGGGGSVLLGRAVLRTLRACVRALNAVTANLEASTEAARAASALAPLQAEALRWQIRRDGGEPTDAEPEPEPDSEELQILRVAATGDEGELERLAERLSRFDEGSTLDRKLTRAEQRLVELLRASRARRQARAAGGRPRAITVVPTKK